MTTDKLDFNSLITSINCEMNSHVRTKLREHKPGHGNVLHGDTCLALLTILNFSPPPHVWEHSDQPVSKPIFKKKCGETIIKRTGHRVFHNIDPGFSDSPFVNREVKYHIYIKRQTRISAT